MAQPKTAQEIYDTIQNMQPDDAFTLADAVLGILKMQEQIAKAVIALDDEAEPGLSVALRGELLTFLRR